LEKKGALIVLQQHLDKTKVVIKTVWRRLERMVNRSPNHEKKPVEKKERPASQERTTKRKGGNLGARSRGSIKKDTKSPTASGTVSSLQALAIK